MVCKDTHQRYDTKIIPFVRSTLLRENSNYFVPEIECSHIFSIMFCGNECGEEEDIGYICFAGFSFSDILQEEVLMMQFTLMMMNMLIMLIMLVMIAMMVMMICHSCMGHSVARIQKDRRTFEPETSSWLRSDQFRPSRL